MLVADAASAWTMEIAGEDNEPLRRCRCRRRRLHHQRPGRPRRSKEMESVDVVRGALAICAAIGDAGRNVANDRENLPTAVF